MDIIHYYILSSEVSSPFSIRFAYLLQTGNCLLKCLTMAFIDFIFENCGSLACWEVATFGDFHYFHSLFLRLLWSMLPWFPTQMVIFDYTLDTVLGNSIVMMS